MKREITCISGEVRGSQRIPLKSTHEPSVRAVYSQEKKRSVGKKKKISPHLGKKGGNRTLPRKKKKKGKSLPTKRSKEGLPNNCQTTGKGMGPSGSVVKRRGTGGVWA